MDQDGTWYGGRCQCRRLCIRWGSNPAPSPKGGSAPPQFSAHFYCGQTAGCIKMPLGTEVGLSPGDFVLHGDPAPSQKRGRNPSPIIGPCLLRPMAAWIKMPLVTEVGLGLRDIVLDEDPAHAPLKGNSPTNFWPMSVVAKRPDGLRCHLVWS